MHPAGARAVPHSRPAAQRLAGRPRAEQAVGARAARHAYQPSHTQLRESDTGGRRAAAALVPRAETAPAQRAAGGER